MSTNLEYRARERQRKEKVGGRPAKLNERKGDRDLEREMKNWRRLFFVGRTTWKFSVAAVTKWEMLVATSEKSERQWKKVNGNTYDISSIKRVTKGLFTWSGGPRSSGVGFFCFHALEDTKQKKLTPLDRGPPLHVNRPLVKFLVLNFYLLLLLRIYLSPH